MKKLFSLLALFLLLFFLLFLWEKEFKQNSKPDVPKIRNTSVLPINTQEAINISYENREYFVYLDGLSGKTIRLIPNFLEEKSTKKIVEENDCLLAINGGFYTKKGKPLGLFMVDGKKYENISSDKTLLTGFFYLDAKGEPNIANTFPNTALTAFQSGPLFFQDKAASTKDDEPARRAVLIEARDKKIYAAIVVFKENRFSGPYLSDLPAIVFKIKEPFTVSRILNLDGGSASFFYTKDGVYFQEQTNVGSIICVK